MRTRSGRYVRRKKLSKAEQKEREKNDNETIHAKTGQLKKAERGNREHLRREVRKHAGTNDRRSVKFVNSEWVLATDRPDRVADPCEVYRQHMTKSGLVYCPKNYRAYAKNWTNRVNTILAELQTEVSKLECIGRERESLGVTLFAPANMIASSEEEFTKRGKKVKTCVHYLSKLERAKYWQCRDTISSMVGFVKKAKEKSASDSSESKSFEEREESKQNSTPQMLQALVEYYKRLNKPSRFMAFQRQYVVAHSMDLETADLWDGQDPEVKLGIQTLLSTMNTVKHMCQIPSSEKNEDDYMYHWVKLNQVVKCMGNMPTKRYFLNESVAPPDLDVKKERRTKQYLLEKLRKVEDGLKEMITDISAKNSSEIQKSRSGRGSKSSTA